jgi:hypothetical protein
MTKQEARALAASHPAYAVMLGALKVTRGNIASLGPAGALGPYESYVVWLRVVDEAIQKAEAAA